MARRALSLAFAAGALAGALLLYTRSLGIWGPILYFPFFGAPAVAGMMALRGAVMRPLGAAPDPSARALEVSALGVMLAPGAGFLIAVSFLAGLERGHCGLVDSTATATVLAQSWPSWIVGEGLAVVALVRRRAALARLRVHHAAATVLAALLAPPLAVLACVATCFETDHGGAAVTLLLPAALAAGSTLVAWTRGRSSATGTALRRVAAAALTLGTGAFLLLPKTPRPRSCVSFSTTTTWGLVAEVGWAVAPCLAVVLYCSSDPAPAID